MEIFESKLTTEVYNNLENPHFRTQPSLADYKSLIKILDKSFFIRDKITLEQIPCFSFFHTEGLACPIFSNREDCLRRCKEFESLYNQPLEVAPINGLWSFFNLCASSGCVGVMLDDEFPVRFFNRLSDMDRQFPTLAFFRIPDAENLMNGVYFSKRGPLNFESGQTIKWNNFEKTDKKCAKYLLFNDPFPGNQFAAHTILTKEGLSIFFQDENTFLGPYISIDGAIPLFSDLKIAEMFSKSIGLWDENSPTKLRDYHEIASINLVQYLNDTANEYPFVDFVLNPTYHRAFQGRFFQIDSKWAVQTVSGVWDIEENEPFKLEGVQLPKGYLGGVEDSILSLHGIKTKVLHPFKRLTGPDLSPFSLEDAEDLIQEEFQFFHEPMHIEEGSIPPVDAFCIDAFDKISGFSYAASNYDQSCVDFGFLIFPDFISAISYISNTILEIDENSRVNGYSLCNGTGKPASDDQIRERTVTTEIRKALIKILSNALTSGYSLKHSNLVKNLMQDASATCEIVECGYFGDFLFYDLSDGAEIESRLDEEQRSSKILGKVSKARLKLHSQTKFPEDQVMQLRSCLGETYGELTPDTISIAATALEEFSNVGKRSDYDYAGISMKIAKIFERELTIRVFRKWRTVLLENTGKEAIQALLDLQNADTTEVDNLLCDYFSKKRKTDLGGMRYVLRSLSEKKSQGPIVSKFKDFLNTLSEPQWLLSEEFATILNDISSKYRNGGVHEHLVDFEICGDAVKRILLDENSALKRLVLNTREK